MRRVRSLKFRSPVVTVLVALLMLGFMAPAANANGVIPKPFTMTVSPSTSPAGASTQFTVTVKNWWVQKLGSVDLSVPAAYSITGALTSRGTATIVGNTVKLRSLNLAFLHWFTVKVTATAACSPSTGNVWSAAAKTGAYFTGSSFLLITPPSHRMTAVTGACSLAFITGRQPADTGPDATISSVASNPDGPPLQVGTYDGASNLITGGSPVSISMAIDDNPSSGILSGTSPVDTSAGIATFDDLSIDQPGDGYTLEASATSFGSVTSTLFNIAGLVKECDAGQDCTGTLSEGGTGGTVTALDDESAALLTMSLTPGGIDCDGYEEQSSTLTFNLTSSSEKEVTMTFDTGLDPYYVQPDDFQVCFQSDTAFPYRDGDGAMTNLGLLPDCETSDYESILYEPPVPPCVESRSVDELGVVSVTFLAPSGDPKGRV
jgi:hypothetical protein